MAGNHLLYFSCNPLFLICRMLTAMNKLVVLSLAVSFHAFLEHCVGITVGRPAELRKYASRCRRLGTFQSLHCFCEALVTGDSLTQKPFDIVSIVISIIRAHDDKEHVARICHFVRDALLARLDCLGHKPSHALNAAVNGMCIGAQKLETSGSGKQKRPMDFAKCGLLNPKSFDGLLQKLLAAWPTADKVEVGHLPSRAICWCPHSVLMGDLCDLIGCRWKRSSGSA